VECPNCKAQNAYDSFYCTACGALIRTPTAPGIGDVEKSLRFILPIGRSWLAIVAGYLGLFSLLPGFGLLAILFGVLALHDLRKHPEKFGSGRAIFAIVMGVLCTVFWIALAISYVGSRNLNY